MSKSFGCLLILTLIFGTSVAAWLLLSDDSTESSLSEERYQVAKRVEVTATCQDFQWRFRYPGPDGVLNTLDDVVAERVLRLPSQTQIKFHVTSDDYIYILGIPLNENDSQDVVRADSNKIRELAIPEMWHYLEHSFDKQGTYDLMVDPQCGYQLLKDPRMGQVVVDDEHDYSLLYPPANPQQPNLPLGQRQPDNIKSETL